MVGWWGDGYWGDGWWGDGSPGLPIFGDDWGPSPSLSASPWEAAIQQGGPTPTTRIIVTVPGGEPVELTALSASITKTGEPGIRMTASASIQREVGQATWDLVTTPGALIRIEHGWHYGGTHFELRPFGVYVLGRSPKAGKSEPIDLDLVDLWAWLDECRLPAPLTFAAGRTRASVITDLVQGAIPGVTLRVLAQGGALGQAFVVERDRAQGIADLARDGGLSAYFDAAGVFTIVADPVLNPSATAASFTDGPSATIVSLESESLFERLYNAVRVVPITTGDNAQAWSPVTVTISDANHPRHSSKIGLRPAFYSSPTIGSSTDAARIGRQRLRAFASPAGRVQVTTWARGLMEPGETFATHQSASWTDDAASGSWLCEQVEHDLVTTLETKITGRSVTDVPTEEA